MRIEIDTENASLLQKLDLSVGVAPAELNHKMSLYSYEAYRVISDLWLKVSWNLQLHYAFSWMGAPFAQTPADVLVLQDAIWEIQPDVLIETGVFRGGSRARRATKNWPLWSTKAFGRCCENQRCRASTAISALCK